MNEYRNASGQLTFDFAEIGCSRYAKVTRYVVSEFDLEPNSEFTNGLDERFQDFKKDGFVVGLEWDCWSGYIVVSQTPVSELMAREIARCIEDKFNS